MVMRKASRLLKPLFYLGKRLLFFVGQSTRSPFGERNNDEPQSGSACLSLARPRRRGRIEAGPQAASQLA
jgi:hypothetical protein